jgi:phosphoribosylformylglycinamidine (FGAM) synthase PurS component
MGRYLTLHHDALILGAMKKLDLLHAISKSIHGKKVVVFDLTRSNEEGAVKVIYEVIEQLLNRVIHSGKYDSKTIFIQKVHILVFANFEPDRAAMSTDRWDVHHIASV